MAFVREHGWDELSIAALAKAAGISRQLVYRHFDDVEDLALELAERFQDEVHATAIAGLERYSGDFGAVMRHLVEVFLIGEHRESLAHRDLLCGHWPQQGPPGAVGRVQARLRRKLVDFWARYYQNVAGLSARDARMLSSFGYSGLHGVVLLVDAGQIDPRAAIDFYVGTLEAAIRALGGRVRTEDSRSERR
jgi:AcrR family transcriptional regulator